MTTRMGRLADATIMISMARPIPAVADQPSSLRDRIRPLVPGRRRRAGLARGGRIGP
jgi:hypothetical protein